MGVFSQVSKPSDGVAWVTGASSGVGRALALKLASEGWTVFATARRTDRLEAISHQAPDPGRIVPAPGDVTDPAQMRAIVERITENHRIALAILKANMEMHMPARHFSAQTVADVIDVNLLGVTNALDPLLREMIDKGRGQVAIMSSAAGFRGLPGLAPYCASKAALTVLAESLAMDLTDYGVRLSVINHGFIAPDRPMLGEATGPFQMTADQAADRIMKALKRGGFEITFPWGLTRFLRLIGLLPSRAYFRVIRAVMKNR